MTQPASTTAPSLSNRLPDVRGQIRFDAELAELTWLKVGGKADALFKPADVDDLVDFLGACPADVPIFPMGLASNLLVRDGGIEGVVIRLGRGFNALSVAPDDPMMIEAGAASLDGALAKAAQKAGIGGLEFFSGIPGTVGGAVRMNAGCYGGETCDVLHTATVVFRDGSVSVMTPADLGLRYRHSDLPDDAIVVGATFRGTPEDPNVIAERIAAIQEKRENSQPIREKTGGSTFANPERDTPGTGSAWQAIDKAGCRGLSIGDAQISEKHCNFMLNTGNAMASELEALGETVRRRVKESQGINLRWEVKRVGRPK